MKLSKLLMGTILIGITIQTVGCSKDDTIKPDTEKESAAKKEKRNIPANCPACGMG